MKTTGQQTIAMRVTVPPHKRPKLWGLVTVAVIHLLLELDARYAGIVHEYLMGMYKLYRACPLVPVILGVIVGLFLWPSRWKLVPARGHQIEGPEEEETDMREGKTQELPSRGGTDG